MNFKFWKKRSSPANLRDPVLTALYGGNLNSSGVRIDESTARSISAVYACVQAIADTISTLPIRVYRRTPDGQELAADDYRYDLLAYAPNRFQNSEEWRDTMLRQYLLHGRAISQVVTDDRGRITDLFPVPTREITPVRTIDGIVYRVQISNTTRQRILLAGEVLDFRGASMDGFTCLSPIRENSETLGIAAASAISAGKYFSNGLRTPGFIRSKHVLTNDGWKNLKDSVDRIKGLNESHNIPVFEEDIDWVAMSQISPADAQLIETRRYSVEDIARIYRVPLHKIGNLDHATFSNIEQQNIDWVVDSLLPRIVKFEKAIDKILFLDSERGKLYCKIDTRGLLRGDSVARANYYRILWNMGVFSVNEIRELEEFNFVDGGDERFRPVNTVELGQEIGKTNK